MQLRKYFMAAAMALGLPGVGWGQGSGSNSAFALPKANEAVLPTEVSSKPAKASANEASSSPSSGWAWSMKRIQPTGQTEERSRESCSTDCGREGRCCTLMVFGDYLLLRARGVDVSYAQPRDGVTALAVPVGPVSQLAPEYKSGFRGGVGVALDEGCTFRAAYTQYHVSASNNVTVPASAPGSLLHSLLVFPTTSNVATDSLDASATYEIDFRFVDMDLTNTLFRCPEDTYEVRWLLGGRYAHLSQEFQARYSILGATTVASNILFDGGGLRLGLEGEYHCRCGVFVYGSGVSNLLAGRFKATYTQNQIFAGQQAATSYVDNRLVEIVETEAGLGWQSKCGRVRLSAGYTFNTWFNAMTTPGWIQSVRDSNFTTNRDNNRDELTFEGLTARVMFKY